MGHSMGKFAQQARNDGGAIRCSGSRLVAECRNELHGSRPGREAAIGESAQIRPPRALRCEAAWRNMSPSASEADAVSLQTVSSLLGHANPQITLTTYADQWAARVDQATAIDIAGVLSGSKTGSTEPKGVNDRCGCLRGSCWKSRGL